MFASGKLQSFSIAGNRGPERIAAVLLRVLIVALLAMKTYSWKLWTANRLFPKVPLIAYADNLHTILFISFFLISLLILIRPLYKPFLLLLLVVEVVAMLGDEMRWQPWLYQFLFIILSFIINRRNYQSAFNAVLFILASTYFFSGIQKLNADFLHMIWQKLVLIRFLHMPAHLYNNLLIYYSGWMIPLFEILSGILILLPKQKVLFAILPVTMHLFILLLLGPWGIRFNMIVLPWNAAMAIFIYLVLLHGKVSFSPTSLFYKSNVVIAFAWLVLPVIGWFGYWDKFFSSSIYSGNKNHLRAYPEMPGNLPTSLQHQLYHSKTNYKGLAVFISAQNWSLSELKVPVPPENRIYLSIADSLVKRYPEAGFVFDIK